MIALVKILKPGVQDGLWVPDTANDWAGGKQIFFPGGINRPDSEGLTVGPDGALYITTERDNARNVFALNSVLRFDPNAPGTTLTPTAQWALSAQGAPATVDLGARGSGDVSAARLSKLHVHGAGFEPGEKVRVELRWKLCSPFLNRLFPKLHPIVDVLASVRADASGLAVADARIPLLLGTCNQEIRLVAPSASASALVTITPLIHR